MRVVVTGAAGLIGSGVAAFLGAKHEVVGIDRLGGPEVTARADIRDLHALAPLLAGAEAIIHVAALHAPHVGRASDLEFRRTNVDGTAALLDLTVSLGIERFVLTSSTSVYGHRLEPGDEAVWIDESVTPSPRDVYDETKLEAEALVRAASRPRLCTAILRMARCFPEPHRDMAVYRLHRGIDRRDVARAHALALQKASAAAQTYVISGEPPFVKKDCPALFRDAAELIRSRLPAVAEKFDSLGWSLPKSIGRIYSPGKAAAELGFTTEYGVETVFSGDCDPRPTGR